MDACHDDFIGTFLTVESIGNKKVSSHFHQPCSGRRLGHSDAKYNQWVMLSKADSSIQHLEVPVCWILIDPAPSERTSVLFNMIFNSCDYRSLTSSTWSWSVFLQLIQNCGRRFVSPGGLAWVWDQTKVSFTFLHRKDEFQMLLSNLGTHERNPNHPKTIKNSMIE